MWRSILLCSLCCWWEISSNVVPAAYFTDEMNSISSDVSKEILNDNSTEPPGDFATSAASAFTMIAVSELGDKTFFIALVLALSHSPIVVFSGAFGALALMTILSAALGLVSSVIPMMWVQYFSAALFLIFGLKMLKEGYSMSSSAIEEEFETVQKAVDLKISSKDKDMDFEAGYNRSIVKWVAVEAFSMTFLAEWGDRSQISTVILAAKDNMFGVIFGATMGHAACTLLAVAGGRMVADRISLKIVTICGGLLFLAFAVWSIVVVVQESTESSSS